MTMFCRDIIKIHIIYQCLDMNQLYDLGKCIICSYEMNVMIAYINACINSIRVCTKFIDR